MSEKFSSLTKNSKQTNKQKLFKAISNYFISEDRVLLLSSDLNSSQSLLPSIKLPLLRFNKKGSCLHLKYKSSGLDLDISIANRSLTRLPPSLDWRATQINIDYQMKDFQVRYDKYVPNKNLCKNCLWRNVI